MSPRRPHPQAQLRLARQLGCIACQCQRHALQAYNPMTLQATMVHDILLGDVARLWLDTSTDIRMQRKSEAKSKLVQMANEADEVLPPEYLQLFW